MIMPRGEPLLLPVNPVFIGASLVVGLAFNMLPLGRIVWMPDLLMVLLVFWAVHQPLRIGMGTKASHESRMALLKGLKGWSAFRTEEEAKAHARKQKERRHQNP